MDSATRERLFGAQHAFDHPVSIGITVAVVATLVIAPLLILMLARAGKIGDEQRGELITRCKSWAVMAPILIVPVLLGGAWTIALVALLSLLCYREYARVTGLFREKLVTLLVVVGIVAVTFTTVDHWYGFFIALGPLTIVVIAAGSILSDRPQGYVQRVALGVLGFVLFGLGLGHLGYFANDADYRPIFLLLLLAVELNDVFAYLAGKTLGRRKLCPNTSPNKTIGGAVGALVMTTTLVAVLGHFVFRGDETIDHPLHLIGLGLLVSICGQLGDLMISSIKRDIGVKDIGTTIPGHGGLLDRFDSLLLVAPAAFHYIGYFRGFGLDQVPRIFSG